MDLTFQEKSAAISLLTVLAVYGYYFVFVLLGTGPASPQEMLGWMIGLVIVLVVLEIVFHAVNAIMAPEDVAVPPDERERLNALRASRIAYWLLSFGVLLVLGRILFGSAVGEEITLLDTANQLLFAFVLAECVHYGAQVYQGVRAL